MKHKAQTDVSGHGARERGDQGLGRKPYRRLRRTGTRGLGTGASAPHPTSLSRSDPSGATGAQFPTLAVRLSAPSHPYLLDTQASARVLVLRRNIFLRIFRT